MYSIQLFMAELQESKVYVTGLAVDVQDDDLRDAFKRYGKITDIYVKRMEKFAFAFVTFEKMEEAEDAIREMGGKNVGGRRVKCDLARPRNRGGNGGGQNRGG